VTAPAGLTGPGQTGHLGPGGVQADLETLNFTELVVRALRWGHEWVAHSWTERRGTWRVALQALALAAPCVGLAAAW